MNSADRSVTSIRSSADSSMAVCLLASGVGVRMVPQGNTSLRLWPFPYRRRARTRKVAAVSWSNVP
jgi:hypothetical protein